MIEVGTLLKFVRLFDLLACKPKLVVDTNFRLLFEEDWPNSEIYCLTRQVDEHVRNFVFELMLFVVLFDIVTSLAAGVWEYGSDARKLRLDSLRIENYGRGEVLILKWAWIRVATVDATSLEEKVIQLTIVLIPSIIRVGFPAVHAVAEVCADSSTAPVRLHVIVVVF